MTNNNSQPDWHAMAEKFDLWLPQITPVGEAMLSQLDVKKGDSVLDVASGTGEPALTLAKHNPAADVIGVDAAEGMVGVANKKLSSEKLTNITFSVMPAEKLAFEDDRFDHITCRFGIMLFDNAFEGIKEIRRVLKPGGTLIFSVWGDEDKMPTMNWTYDVFKDKVSESDMPPLKSVTSLGKKGALEDLLHSAGFTDINLERKIITYLFSSFEEYWQLILNSDILKRQFDALPDLDHEEIKLLINQKADDYVSELGLQIPHEYILAKIIN